MAWENDQFGHCTLPCSGEQECAGVFYYSEKLHVFCVNDHCTHQRRYSVPYSILSKIADKWNEDAEKAQTKEKATKAAVLACQ